MTGLLVFASMAVLQGPTTGLAKPVVALKIARELQGIRPLAYAPSASGSQVAVTLEDKSVRIIDAKTQQTLRVFQGHPQPAYAVAWSDDGSFLATGDESARIFIWDARTGKQLKMIYGEHQRGIQKLSFNHSRTLLMSTGKDDKILIWSIPGGKKVGEVLGKGANLYSGCFNPLTDYFVSATLTNSARLFRQTGSGPKILNFFGSDPQGQLDVCWNHQGTMVLTGEKSGNAVLFDVKALKKYGTLKGHMDFVTSVGFAPNGKVAVTASSDRTVRLWDTKSLSQVALLENQSGVGSPVTFTADGKYLITVGVSDYMQIYSVTPPLVVAEVKKTVKKKK